MMLPLFQLTTWAGSARTRAQAFRQALKQHGEAGDPAWVQEGDHRVGGGHSAMLRILAANGFPPPCLRPMTHRDSAQWRDPCSLFHHVESTGRRPPAKEDLIEPHLLVRGSTAPFHRGRHTQ